MSFDDFKKKGEENRRRALQERKRGDQSVRMATPRMGGGGTPLINRMGRTQSSKAHEKDVARRIKGKRQPMSGARDEAKSDVVSDRLRIDCKERLKVAAKSFRVTLEMLKKLSFENLGQNLIPVIEIRFRDPPPLVEKDWVLLPLAELEKLLERLD